MEYLIIYLIFSAAIAGFSKDFIQIINTNDNPLGIWFLSKRHIVLKNWWTAKVLSCSKCFSQYLSWLLFIAAILICPELQFKTPLITALFGVSFGFITGLFAD